MENSGTHWKCVLKTWFSIIISQVFPKKTVSSSIFKGGWLSRALVTKLSCPHLHSLTIYIFRSGLCQSSNCQLSLVSTQYVGPLCTLQCFVLYFKFSNFFTQCNVAVLESAPLPTCFTRLRTFSSFKILCTFQPYLKSFEKSLYCIFVCVTICRAMNEVLLYDCYLKLRNSLSLYLIPLKIQ